MRTDKSGIVVGAFRDQKNLPIEPFRGAMDFCAEFFEKSHRGIVDNRVAGVEAQRIDVEVTDPIQSILNEIVSYFIAELAVEIHRRSPRSIVAIGKIGAEVGEIIPLGSQMVIDYIEDHC